MTLEPILEIRGLKTVFRVRGREIAAVDGVNLVRRWSASRVQASR